MLLGRYAPDTLVITTPNYEFNQLFTNPPDSSPVGDNSIEGRTSGFLDPTKRTLRLYRHHDHKFEWTREEFHLWCYSNAQSWGYSVEISGVGTSLEPDPWARDKAMTHVDGTPSYATQTAIFKRDRGKEEHRDLYEQRAIHKLDCLQAGTNHQLVMEHSFKRHPGLEAALPSVPESHSVILDLIKDALSEWFRFDEVDLADLWNIDAISIACRGSLEVLYDALIFGGITSESSGRINRHELVEWEWVEPKKRARWARRIRWTRYEPRQHEDEWGLLVEEESQPISTESPWQTVKRESLWKRSNKGIAQRIARDDAAWAKLNSRTAESVEEKLQKKSAIYEKLQKGRTGGLSQAQIDALLVDFDSKDTLDSSSEEDPDREAGSQGEGDSLVEIMDEFGRTRRVERSKVPRAHSTYREQAEAEYVDESTVLRGPHISNFPVYQPSAERVAKIMENAMEDPITKHYDGTNENRAKGAGFYQFSTDEEVRKQQMKDLASTREETILARERNKFEGDAEDEAVVSRASSKRKRELEERRALLDAKKRKKSVGVPFSDAPANESHAKPDEPKRIVASSLDAMDFLAQLSSELRAENE
ncbi:hypothetical protein FRC17_010770 [Serendipita sp. 399]|nr:hypothetical protein FRC17_010770 [Serendipita sp. 399]